MGVQPRLHHCSSSSLLALNHLNRINLTKMSETEVKTDAPTAEEIKGTKRTAEDARRSQKAKDREWLKRCRQWCCSRRKRCRCRRGRGRRRRRGGRRRLNFLVCCHPTSSFRTTYTKYATSSSSLLYKTRGKKRSTASVRKVPQSKRAKCQTNSLLSTKRQNIRCQNEKKVSQEMVFSLKRNKKESFLPPFKTKN